MKMRGVKENVRVGAIGRGWGVKGGEGIVGVMVKGRGEEVDGGLVEGVGGGVEKGEGMVRKVEWLEKEGEEGV